MTTATRPRRLAPGPPSDASVVGAVARARVAVAIGSAATGSFLPGLHGNRSTLFLLVGLVWLPWTAVVLFSAGEPNRRLALLGGPAGDVAALVAVLLLAPDAKQGVLIGCLIVLAFAAATVGRAYAAGLSIVTLGVVWLSQPLVTHADRLSPGTLLPFSAAVVVLLILFGRTAAMQERATRRYQGMAGKAEGILAHVADAVVVTDSRGLIMQCNPAATRVLGVPEDALVGGSCSQVLGLHVDSRSLDCSHGCRLLHLDGPRAGSGHEVWRTHPSGRRQPILADAAEVPSPEGPEVVHSFRDVTRLKEAEEAKTLFLATASHELKTPLTVINGFAETLSRYQDLDPQTSKAALDAIRTRAQELTRIVDRLLLSSRIEAGRVVLPLRLVALPAVLTERATALAATTGRAITCEVEPGLPLVNANMEALVSVVDHLLDNALKYSPAGDPVSVRAHACDRVVRIDVADRGIGMDAEQLGSCFEKFWQAESSDVRRFGGTGLGLYIVRSLVEGMGGTVSVHSEPGHGSTFAIELATEVAPPAPRRPDAGEPSSIREFMRQLGVPERARP